MHKQLSLKYIFAQSSRNFEFYSKTVHKAKKSQSLIFWKCFSAKSTQYFSFFWKAKFKASFFSRRFLQNSHKIFHFIQSLCTEHHVRKIKSQSLIFWKYFSAKSTQYFSFFWKPNLKASFFSRRFLQNHTKFFILLRARCIKYHSLKICAPSFISWKYFSVQSTLYLSFFPRLVYKIRISFCCNYFLKNLTKFSFCK